MGFREDDDDVTPYLFKGAEQLIRGSDITGSDVSISGGKIYVSNKIYVEDYLELKMVMQGAGYSTRKNEDGSYVRDEKGLIAKLEDNAGFVWIYKISD